MQILIVLKYVNAVIFDAPVIPTKAYLTAFRWGTPDAIYHGPTAFTPASQDPYTPAKEMGIYREIPEHRFQDVNARNIVKRIMKSRDMYEERQRKKGVKAVGEEEQKHREALGREQKS